jgi:hypothetical protein
LRRAEAKRAIEESLGRPIKVVDGAYLSRNDNEVYVLLTEDDNIMPEGSAKTLRVTVFINDQFNSQHIVRTDPL